MNTMLEQSVPIPACEIVAPSLAALGLDVFRWSVRRPFRLTNLFAQLDFVGVGSIFIVGLTGLFTGTLGV